MSQVRPEIIQALTRLAETPAVNSGAKDPSTKLAIGRYLQEPFDSFLLNAGKLTRPAIYVLGAMTQGDLHDLSLTPALAIEIFQAAALIHDDIADKGRLRRGEPCLYLKEGTGLAINCGDLGLAATFGVICQDGSFTPELKDGILQEIYAMCYRTIQGQALDLGWVRDGRWDLTPENYLDMATLKTAHYSAATPLVTGAMAAGAEGRLLDQLREFGLACGLAFQIQDDLLNVVGDAAEQGKDFRSDLAEGKRTLLVISALETLSEPERRHLITLLNEGAEAREKVDEAAEIIENSGVVPQVRQYALQLTTQAQQILQASQMDAQAKEILLSMADYFVERSF